MNRDDYENLSHALLDWYDYHKRELPWRDSKGNIDPYRVWLSEIMLQQTSVAAVKPYFEKFIKRFPTLASLARTKLDNVLQLWAGLGYYSRARNLHACAKRIMSDFNGVFPPDEKELRRLPGIGAYTAGAILAIAFNRKAIAIDGNVERVISRLFMIEETFPKARKIVSTHLDVMTPENRPGDFVQALMDLGATLCTPKKPACGLCPWRKKCLVLAEGQPETLPKKMPKPEREYRKGAIFIVERADGAILLRKRAPHGLLGGMTEFPGSLWISDYDYSKAMLDAPCEARWQRLEGHVKHVFSHFTLELAVFYAKAARTVDAPEGMYFCSAEEFKNEALPSVMRKVWALKCGERALSRP